MSAAEVPPEGLPTLRPRRRLVRHFVDAAIVAALGPAIFMAVAAFGVLGGIMDWQSGFAGFAAWLSPRLALATIATGMAALIAAVSADFDRLWLRALLALSLSAATLAGYVWSRADRPPPAPTAAVTTSAR
ncbi:MAG: hypothetical protein ABW042_08100 [Phenylobacterium sp.]